MVRIGHLTVANTMLGVAGCVLLIVDYMRNGDDIGTMSGIGYGLLGVMAVLGFALMTRDETTYRTRR